MSMDQVNLMRTLQLTHAAHDASEYECTRSWQPEAPGKREVPQPFGRHNGFSSPKFFAVEGLHRKHPVGDANPGKGSKRLRDKAPGRIVPLARVEGRQREDVHRPL